MRDQIYKVENAEPENAGAENAGLEIAGLEIAEPKAQRWKMKPPPRASMWLRRHVEHSVDLMTSAVDIFAGGLACPFSGRKVASKGANSLDASMLEHRLW